MPRNVVEEIAERNQARKAVIRFLKTWAHLAGVEWSDQLQAEIIAAVAAAIRAHTPRKDAGGIGDPMHHRNSVPRGTQHHI